MIIVPHKNFTDARDVPARYDSLDPRRNDFQESEVVIDLRECRFVRPAAEMLDVVLY